MWLSEFLLLSRMYDRSLWYEVLRTEAAEFSVVVRYVCVLRDVVAESTLKANSTLR